MWSWALAAVGLAGFFLAGRKVWWAWYVNIANQGLWTAYALYTDQLGFLAGAAVYLVVFSMNAYRWTREHFAERRPRSSGTSTRWGAGAGEDVPVVKTGTPEITVVRRANRERQDG
jgi:hypothetical protein